ncbi:MAG: sugar transferase [Deltaproteobacteria bacterium]|nr:sugar transferase [Deltaproteobacteria bacterium]
MALGLKRLLDVTLAGGALLVGAPLLAVLAAAVKLDSPGPAMFVQTRVGRGGRPFRIMKLRTMTTGGEGAQITAHGDKRITRVGALLRRTKLDELPQLWNVVRGDMSIVGPRPEVPDYVARYRPEWRPLLDVRPGLTDLASLSFRGEEELLALAHDRERAYTEVVMPMKLQLALEGLERSSVADDLRLIAQTALAVIRRGGDDPIVEEARRRIEDLNAETTS